MIKHQLMWGRTAGSGSRHREISAYRIFTCWLQPIQLFSSGTNRSFRTYELFFKSFMIFDELGNGVLILIIQQMRIPNTKISDEHSYLLHSLNLSGLTKGRVYPGRQSKLSLNYFINRHLDGKTLQSQKAGLSNCFQ